MSIFGLAKHSLLSYIHNVYVYIVCLCSMQQKLIEIYFVRCEQARTKFWHVQSVVSRQSANRHRNQYYAWFYYHHTHTPAHI